MADEIWKTSVLGPVVGNDNARIDKWYGSTCFDGNRVFNFKIFLWLTLGHKRPRKPVRSIAPVVVADRGAVLS